MSTERHEHAPIPIAPVSAGGDACERARLVAPGIGPDAAGRFERVGDGLLLRLDDGRTLTIRHLFAIDETAPRGAAATGPTRADPSTPTPARIAPGYAPARPHAPGDGRRDAGTWRLDGRGWNLLSPDGQAVELTLAEQQVLRRLAACPGRPVDRMALITCLADDVHAFDPHRLEVLVYRLRRKCRRTAGVELPLRAVRGVGYTLTW